MRRDDGGATAALRTPPCLRVAPPVGDILTDGGLWTWKRPESGGRAKEGRRQGCDARHCGSRRVVPSSTDCARRSDGKETGMLYRQQRQRAHELRLQIGAEAEALISNLGDEAYWVARRRAEEASSDAIARDWSGVALAISRKTRKRPAPRTSTVLH